MGKPYNTTAKHSAQICLSLVSYRRRIPEHRPMIAPHACERSGEAPTSKQVYDNAWQYSNVTVLTVISKQQGCPSHLEQSCTYCSWRALSPEDGRRADPELSPSSATVTDLSTTSHPRRRILAVLVNSSRRTSKPRSILLTLSYRINR